jgi:transposase
VALLTGKGQMSRRNTRECLAEVFRLPLALGTISKIERRVAAALTAPEAAVAAAVQAAPVVYSDETRWREGKQHPWLWVLSTLSCCLFRITDHRDRESFMALFGADGAARTLVSDRYSAYGHLPAARHGFCWAHLDRDFLAAAQSSDPCSFLGRYCLEEVDRLFTHWRQFRAGILDRLGLAEALQPVQQRLRTWLTWGAAAGGKKLSGFFGNLLTHWESLWVFVVTEGVEPTNNRSERLLRPGVRWRKTSYGTQSAMGRRYAERILTVSGTLTLQKRPLFPFLLDICRAAVGEGDTPSLLPSPL